MWISSRFFVIFLLLHLGRCHLSLRGKTLGKLLSRPAGILGASSWFFPKSVGTRLKVCLVPFVFPPAVREIFLP